MVAYDISRFRASIDAIDDQILDLLNERSQIVKKVGLTKSEHVKEGVCFIRSGREADVVRRIYESSRKGIFPSHFAAAIWRIIISASLSLETALKVSVATSDESLYWLAREYFGIFTPITRHKKSKEALNDVVKNRTHVAVLPAHKDGWWLHLPEDIKVFACIPFVLQKKERIEAFAVARLTPEETVEDMTLLRMKAKHAVTQAKVKAAFGRHGIQSRLIDAANNAGLIEIKGFIKDQDKIISNVIKETGAQIRVIGAYATPMML